MLFDTGGNKDIYIYIPTTKKVSDKGDCLCYLPLRKSRIKVFACVHASDCAILSEMSRHITLQKPVSTVQCSRSEISKCRIRVCTQGLKTNVQRP